LGRYPSGYDAYQRIVNTRVKLLSRIGAEVVEGSEGLQGLAVGALGCKCVERVGCTEDSGAERNRFARQSEWIADSIPTLVVVLDVLERLLDVK
jgi:hypothetical protein